MELHALPNRLGPDNYTGDYTGNYDVSRGYGDDENGPQAYNGNRGYAYNGNMNGDRKNYGGESNTGGNGFGGNSLMDGANSYSYTDGPASAMSPTDDGSNYASSSGYQYIAVSPNDDASDTTTPGSHSTVIDPASTSGPITATPTAPADAPKHSPSDKIPKRKLSFVQLLTRPIRAHRRRKEEEQRREKQEVYDRMFGFLSRAEFPSASFDPQLSPSNREIAAEQEGTGGSVGRRSRRRGSEGKKK